MARLWLKLLLVGLLTSVFAAISLPAFAQVGKLNKFECQTLGLQCTGNDTAASLSNYILNVLNVFLGLLGVIALIAIIYGGAVYLTAGGDEKAITRAKNILIYAVIGIVVIALSVTLVNFVFGAVKLQLPDFAALDFLPGGNDLAGTVQKIINAFLVLIGVLALIYLIVAGIKYITSQGDDKRAGEARSAILYAIIGLVIIGLSWVIVNFVFRAAGLGASGLPGGDDLAGRVMAVINGFLVLIGVLAVIYLVYAGVKYITSAGDDKKAGEAKQAILYTVIGLVVIGLAAVLVNFVASAVGLGNLLPGGGNLPAAVFLVINAFLTLVAIVAAIYIIIGGVKYITSQGDDKKAAEAKNTILYAVLGLVVIGLAVVIVNFTTVAAGGAGNLPAFSGTLGGSNLVGAIRFVINGFLTLAAIVAAIYLIIGGVKYITSQGDDTKAEEAKKTILYALIGLIVIGLSVIAVNFVVDAVRGSSFF